MPMWTCDVADCAKPAVRNLGDCVLCKRHLCSTHLQPTFHQCPKWADADNYDPAARTAQAEELEELIKKINTTALETRARHLRGGIPCSIPPLEYNHATHSSVMGGMNYHVEISFDDGVKWIVRIRRFNTTSPPPALRDYIFQSEVATLKFLESINIPAPRVYDFALEGKSNPIGVGYILIEKLKGSSLQWSLATPEQGKNLMTDLADIFIQLSKHPFKLLGSLDCPTDPSHVGPFARESLTDFTPTSEMLTMGPFSSWEEYHRSSLQLTLDLIRRSEMYTQRPVDAYLIHRFLLDILPTVLSSASAVDNTDGNSPRYFLKHADDKGDHIMVDEDFHITGIIDWEWAHTAPLSHAFNSPMGLLPVSEFYNSKNELGDDEVVFAELLEAKNNNNTNSSSGSHGGVDLAGCVRQGRLQHRFAFCSGYDLEDWDGFLGLFRGLREAVGIDDGLDWDGWKRGALRRYEDDDGLRWLLRVDTT
ncbi:hypothetical protein GGS24DRAFT_472212 [Hypoxylon argillaceum]|nr:hypothetical protein GGS24DRAFT_472212 [Hypoxylon argillaceum]